MKKLIAGLAFCVFFMLFGFSTEVYAKSKDKEYSIQSAEFEVHLDENGDAYVNEKWDLNFEKGNFSRFYLERLKDTNELEKYDDIVFENFKIDGQECEQSPQYVRKDNTYSIDHDEDKLEYEWHFSAQEDTKLTLEDSYKLTNVVKANDRGYAFFCYRFVGANLDKEIEKLKINIYAPDSCTIELRNKPGMKYHIYDDNIELTDKDSSGLVKVNIAMDRGVFADNIASIDQAALDKIAKADKMHEMLKKAFYISVFCIVSLVIFIIARIVILTAKYNKLAQDKSYVDELINKLKINDITPFEFSKLCNIQKISMNEFKLIFLDLLRRNIISISNEKIIINHEVQDSLKPFEQEFLKGASIFEKEDKTHKKFIDMKDLFAIVQNSNLVSKITKTYDSRYIHNYKKKMKKEINVLKRYFNYYSLGYTNELSEILAKYKKQNYIEIENLYYMASKIFTTTKTEKDYRNDFSGYSGYDAYLYMDYYSHSYSDNSSSSSGGSGCSSCSSCSGCGGGGAD